MIITIGTLTLFIVLWGIVVYYKICDKLYELYNNKLREYYKMYSEKELKNMAEVSELRSKRERFDKNRDREILTLLTASATIIAVFNSIILLCMCGPITVEDKYTQLMHEKSVLEWRLESKTEIGNEHLYSDIVQFNNQLTSYKVCNNNLFINWYVPDKIAEIDYIEIYEVNDEKSNT